MKMNLIVKTDDGSVYESGFAEVGEDGLKEMQDFCERCHEFDYLKFSNNEKKETYYFPKECITRSVITLKLED